MHLKLSHIDLNDHTIVAGIITLIKESQALCHLDLSWTNLSAKHLSEIFETLVSVPAKIRQLNVSYNFIYRDKPQHEPKLGDPANEPTGTQTFISNFKQLMLETTCLNHLDISGMDLT